MLYALLHFRNVVFCASTVAPLFITLFNVQIWITPAHAGKTAQPLWLCLRYWDHPPRVRGKHAAGVYFS